MYNFLLKVISKWDSNGKSEIYIYIYSKKMICGMPVCERCSCRLMTRWLAFAPLIGKAWDEKRVMKCEQFQPFSSSPSSSSASACERSGRDGQLARFLCFTNDSIEQLRFTNTIFREGRATRGSLEGRNPKQMTGDREKVKRNRRINQMTFFLSID